MADDHMFIQAPELVYSYPSVVVFQRSENNTVCFELTVFDLLMKP